MKLTARYRRSIACLCAVAMVVLGLSAQAHGLSHAVQTVQALVQGDPQADHGLACEQCLKFAVFNGAVAAHVAPLLLHGSGDGIEPSAFAPSRPVEVFTAYVSRAPPRLA